VNRWKTLEHWYWLITDGLLIAKLSGWAWGLPLLIALTAVQAVHFLLLERRIMAFPVQVRLGYLLLLVGGAWPPLRFIHWLQLAGTTAVVAVGYCPLARMLALMPWNRREPLTLSLIWWTITAPPVTGSILNARAGD